MTRFGLVCFAFMIAACSLKADYTGTLYECGPGGACPDGHVCIDQRCVPTEPEPAACAVAMAAGADHTCAIRTDGTAWCWGRNDFRQLGDGPAKLEDHTSPVQVAAPMSGPALPRFTAITGGTDHSCALGADGTVWCWGHNVAGQLGNNTMNDSGAPVLVSDVTSAIAIAAGRAHNCAVLRDGSVTCWGANNAGQLGNGNMNGMPVSTPATIQGLGGVTAVAAGGDTTCAVTDQGALSCWGANTVGQLGDGTSSLHTKPNAVPIDGAVVSVAVGHDFTCALTGTGSVLCAGQNLQGQLGQGNLINPPVPGKPMQVALPGNSVAITAGDEFACSLDAQARVWCWGADDNNQLADPIGSNDLSHSVPALTTYQGVKDLVGGGAHLCARSAAGGITCSGYNGHGQLGDGRRTTQGAPQPAPGLAGVQTIDGGGASMCATLGDSTVTCWGDDRFGQLGDGSRNERTAPTLVEQVGTATQVAVGGDFACALRDDKTAMCWGGNDTGELGDGTPETHGLPRPVIDKSGSPLGDLSELAASGLHACALGASGVSCWGNNVNTPASVTGLPAGVHGIAVGAKHACGIDSNKVWCWGDNSLGQLGAGNSLPTTAPVMVVMLGLVDQISAAASYTCAHVVADGSVWCWGNNSDGELGDNVTTRSATPVQAMGLSGTTKVVAGGSHACALKSDQSVSCWGANALGQLGDASYASHLTPMPIPGLSHVLDLSASDGSVCALLEAGNVSCWGDDRRGQLGDGIVAEQSPVAPLLPCP